MLARLPRLDEWSGLHPPILAGCHPSLVSVLSKGSEGGAGEPGLAGVPELREDTWHTWRREASQPRAWVLCPARLALTFSTHDWLFKRCLLHGQFDYFSFLLFF